MQRQALPFLFAGVTLVAGLSAQCSEGPFVGAPFAMSFAEGGGGVFASHQSYHKGLGFLAVAPSTWTGPAGMPHFDFALAVQGCSGWLSPLPDIDAMSVGKDWILADDATGRAVVPQDRWGSLTFSVTRGTLGRPGTALRTESSSRRDAVGGDLFSYILPGSAMPGSLVGVAERVHDSREIDSGAIAQELDALDHFAHLFTSEPFVQTAMGTNLQWFFSLSNAHLGRVHPFVWNGTTPSGATIFQMTWQPSTSTWSCPQIWKTYAELGLNATEDLDALAVDLERQRILFSTKSAARDPILFLYYGTDMAVPVPYANAQGQPVSGDIGLIDDDDVDAVCAIDPSVRASTAGLSPYAFFMGTPRPKQFLFLPPADLSSSAFRETVAGPANSSYRSFVKGWPATGVGPGVAALFWSLADQPGTLVPFTVLARHPLSAICGDPISAQIPVPDLPASRGVQVDLRWFVADQALVSIHEAFPIQVRL